MIISVQRCEPVAPSIEADRVLDGIEFRFVSGNICVVTPSVKRLEGDACRININYAFVHAPSDMEKFEVERAVNQWLGAKPEFVTELVSFAQSERMQEEWLRDGKPPEKVRRVQ